MEKAPSQATYVRPRVFEFPCPITSPKPTACECVQADATGRILELLKGAGLGEERPEVSLLLYLVVQSSTQENPFGCGAKSMVPFWLVGAPPILVYFSGDWDAHWGYGILTHGHLF